MAHGDYHCCALCDSKMDYSNDPRTKEDLCPYCTRRLIEAGIPVFDGSDLLQWMKEQQDSGNGRYAKEALTELGFSMCFYGNDVDRMFSQLGNES